MKMLMPFAALLAVVLTLLSPLALASRQEVTPVQKVLDMLNEMKKKGETMMATEKTTYASYKEWVGDRTTELGFEIIEAKRKIEELVASIEKTDSDAAQLGAGVAELDKDISRLESEKKDATSVREAEHAEFVSLETDYSESVDALERAIQTLTSQAYDRPQAESLLQKMSKTVAGMPRVLAALQEQEDRQDGAPAVAAYEFQAGGIVEILNGLLKKFKTELVDTVSDEANKDHYYQLTMLHLSNTITKSTADREEKAALKASKIAASEQAQGELATTKTSLAEAQKFLADMTALFQAKSATFAANQQVRAGELEALAKAIDIISSSSVADSYASHINLAQLPGTTRQTFALLQTRSKRSVALRQRASEMLTQQSKALSSQTLETLAKEISSGPFDKVTEMIETLLSKLKEEAIAEATHKQWCDEQLKANKLKREKKTAAQERLSAEVEALDASIAAMAADLETLAKEQQKLTEAMAEASKQRAAEKNQNEATIADAKAGNTAVKQALVILREFYAKQSLLQEKNGRQVPEMEEYKGMGGEKTGVVGMLEVIESDFARLEADTTEAEAQAVREYDEFMADASADKKQKHDAEVKLKLQKDQAEFEQSQTTKDLDAVEAELAKANDYYEKLKPSCLEVHVSYEERVAKRKEEIEALKQAYSILASKSTE